MKCKNKLCVSRGKCRGPAVASTRFRAARSRAHFYAAGRFLAAGFGFRFSVEVCWSENRRWPLNPPAIGCRPWQSCTSGGGRFAAAVRDEPAGLTARRSRRQEGRRTHDTNTRMCESSATQKRAEAICSASRVLSAPPLTSSEYRQPWGVSFFCRALSALRGIRRRNRCSEPADCRGRSPAFARKMPCRK